MFQKKPSSTYVQLVVERKIWYSGNNAADNTQVYTRDGRTDAQKRDERTDEQTAISNKDQNK